MSETSSASAKGWVPVAPGKGVPSPAGAYSPGACAGGFIFVSGQIPKDPGTGEIVGSDIEAQTGQVIRNLAAVLENRGATLADVVSVTIYLANPDDWGRFDAAYRTLMPEPYPARTTVGALLRGILIEISATAYAPGR